MAIEFNNFRITCITQSTPNPLPSQTRNPAASKPSASPTTSEQSLLSICVMPPTDQHLLQHYQMI